MHRPEPIILLGEYIDKLLGKDPEIDTIILGCTHYPLMIDKIRQYTPQTYNLCRRASLWQKSLADYLVRHPEMDAQCSKNGQCEYFTTEDPRQFSPSASVFMCDNVEAQQISLQ